MDQDDLDRAVEAFLASQPSREACVAHLRQQGFPEDKIRAAVAQRIERKRHAARERLEGAERKGNELARHLESGEPLPSSAADYCDAAREMRDHVRSRLRSYGLYAVTFFLAGTALLGLTVVFSRGRLWIQGALWWLWVPGIGALSVGAGAWRVASRALARRRRVDRFARENGWWE